jgi:hypothetical protein
VIDINLTDKICGDVTRRLARQKEKLKQCTANLTDLEKTNMCVKKPASFMHFTRD